jgi:hypothetical protein
MEESMTNWLRIHLGLGDPYNGPKKDPEGTKRRLITGIKFLKNHSDGPYWVGKGDDVYLFAEIQLPAVRKFKRLDIKPLDDTYLWVDTREIGGQNLAATMEISRPIVTEEHQIDISDENKAATEILI